MARQNQKAALRLVEEASARKARERQGQQKPKSKMGQWIYILEEVWVLHLIMIVCLTAAGIYFGIGHLPSYFSLLFSDHGGWVPLLRAIIWVLALGAGIYVAKKLFVKEPMNVGNRIARTLTIIWTGFVLVVLWAFWAGIL